MKTPNWGLVIGILMILFGGCSVSGDLQSINSPNIFDMQQDMLKGMSDGFNTTVSDSLISTDLDSTQTKRIKSDPGKMVEAMSNTMNTMFYMSDFTKTWIVRFGYIGVIVSFIYILGGVFLLVRKPFSLKLAYGALGLSILFSIIQSIVLSLDSSSSLLAMTAGYSQMFGVIIDIILIIVIVSSDKTAYHTQIES